MHVLQIVNLSLSCEQIQQKHLYLFIFSFNNV